RTGRSAMDGDWPARSRIFRPPRRSASARSLTRIRRRGREGSNTMRDDDVRAALQRHWAASDANDFAAEHEIYQDHAVLEYPQSGERIRGRRGIQESRMAQPNRKRFA